MKYRVYQEIYYIITGCILLALLGFFIHYFLIILSIIILLISIFIFRDPIRVTPVHKNIIIAPCDGYINTIEKVIKPYNVSKYTNNIEYYKISFYISIFNVQLNYMPSIAKIIDIQYYFFFPQKNIIIFETPNKDVLILTQVCSLFTYSIICDLEVDQTTTSGEKIGMLKVGNTIELYIPTTFKLLLKEGQSCIGGETIIALFNNNETNQIEYLIH